MDDHLDESSIDGQPNRRRRPGPTSPQGGGAVYGLGVIGALVWFCRQATEPGEYLTAVLKALVWPAFLVYRAFEVVDGMKKTQGWSDTE